MPQLIDTVLRSFAAHAAPDSWLVIKNHPLDTGLVPYAGQIDRLSAELGIEGRTCYLETGHLPTLLEHARGVITVNSTVGMSALTHRRPTIALGTAIYDLPGLTFQGRLDQFWEHASPPEQKLFRAFRDTVIHTTQVNGDFYTADGIRQAIDGCGRFLSPQSPLQHLLSRHPTTLPTRAGRAARR
jgi:capsular polysaccharide export protein